MKEFIEKLIERFEEEYLQAEKDMELSDTCDEASRCGGRAAAYEKAQKIVNQLAEEYNNGWIPCNDQLPPHSDDLLLVQCNGKPRNNINFVNAFCLASYTEEGWTLEMYPDWRDAEVVAWKNLGEPYQPKGE